MVDYNSLRKKFQPKTPPKTPRASKAAIEAITREYEAKKASLGSGAPMFRRGPLFYGLVILVLIVAGALVVPEIMRGGLALGKKRIDRNALQARKAMDALSRALGRYKFHVGDYPTAAEGLASLAYRRPHEIQAIRARHAGWDGPYVNHIVKDPWGNDYVYEPRPDGGHPILYSKGPDGRAGTTDDVLPEQDFFDEAFRDTTWTNGWAPCELRGYVVAPDEETRRRVQEEMKKYDVVPEGEQTGKGE